MPPAPIGHDTVVAQDAFQPGAQPLDGAAGLLVQFVGLQLHALAAQPLEGMAQHQVLGLGVDEGPLP